MPSNIRNLEFLKQQPGWGPRLYEALSDMISNQQALTQQTNGSVDGQPAPPPQVNGVNVTGQGGFLHVAVTDNNQIYRGIRYYTEHADNAQFQNAQIVPMGDSRNVTIPVGNQSRYVRVYSSYISSPPSPPVYHGGVTPIAVSGGGTSAGPSFLPSQGSGTGTPGQALTGPGIAPYRSPNGAPPVRL
jgi:hypothetical protein